MRAVRLWVDRYGPLREPESELDARPSLRQPHSTAMDLDEVFVKINGLQHYLWWP